MQENNNEKDKQENDNNRSGIDRRQFSYSYHIPERRSGEDRRLGLERRNIIRQRSGVEHLGH
jgi:hypothetical protein